MRILFEPEFYFTQALESKDPQDASKNFLEALRGGYDPITIQKNHDNLQGLSRTSQKEFERYYIMSRSAELTFPNLADSEGISLFERSYFRRYYKNCARLLFLGADLPYSLPQHDKDGLQNLREQIQVAINIYQRPAIEIISEKFNGNTEALSLLCGISKIAEFELLLRLLGMACMGIHDLSHQYDDPNYDSDDDLLTMVRSSPLKVALDDNAEPIEFHLPTNNDCTKGALIKALFRLTSLEVFKNEGRPYFADNDQQSRKFEKGCDEAVFRLIPQGIQASDHNELIVRMLQCLDEFGEDGRAVIQKIYPSLYNYYKDDFLFEVEGHLRLLGDRMFHLPIELFEV
jgi:hypothetical protein